MGTIAESIALRNDLTVELKELKARLADLESRLSDINCGLNNSRLIPKGQSLIKIRDKWFLVYRENGYVKSKPISQMPRIEQDPTDEIERRDGIEWAAPDDEDDDCPF